MGRGIGLGNGGVGGQGGKVICWYGVDGVILFCLLAILVLKGVV